MMILKKNEFIDLEFTARIKETGIIFDTNVKANAKEVGLEEVRPLRVCIGEGMVLKGFDSALEGKEIGKDYEVEINAENAFGKRDPSLIKTIPVSVFLEKEVNPYPGMILNLDGIIARISSVSGGRVLTDFNNPLAGKTVIYEFKVLKKIEDKTEKLKILSEFYIGADKFELKEDKAVFSGTFHKKAFELLSKKAKELLSINVEIGAKLVKKNIDENTVEVGGIKVSKA